ncbi:MAG: hypothetical protein HYW25_00980 [Candidatus Aenigmarchaeota archaeon]|nr:hypothetical protein [Candidatus Aenigmarchaeota archaeon]
MKSSIAAAIIIAILASGCIGQVAPLKFETMRDAFESGLSLHCEKTEGNVIVNYYIADENIRTEIASQESTSYSIITKDDSAYVWFNNSQKVTTIPPIIGGSIREGALGNSFENVTCFEEPVPERLFRPPEQ